MLVLLGEPAVRAFLWVRPFAPPVGAELCHIRAGLLTQDPSGVILWSQNGDFKIWHHRLKLSLKTKAELKKETLALKHLHWKQLYWHWNKYWHWKNKIIKILQSYSFIVFGFICIFQWQSSDFFFMSLFFSEIFFTMSVFFSMSLIFSFNFLSLFWRGEGEGSEGRGK